MRISDWSSDVCSSDLSRRVQDEQHALELAQKALAAEREHAAVIQKQAQASAPKIAHEKAAQAAAEARIRADQEPAALLVAQQEEEQTLRVAREAASKASQPILAPAKTRTELPHKNAPMAMAKVRPKQV